MKRGFVSNEQRATRALSHGKITSLTTAFRLKNGNPFSLVIVPKASVTAGVISAPENAGLIVNCTMYEDDAAADYPVMFNWPSEALFFEISDSAIDLDNYDVYWSCGSEDEPYVES